MLFKGLFIDSGLFNLPNEIVRKENDMENSWISDNEAFGLPVHVFHFFFRLESLCINGCQNVTDEGLETVIKKHGAR